MTRLGLALCLIATMLVVAACSSSVAERAGAPQPTPLPAPLPAQLPVKEYRIQPGDQLDIKFFYNPELNEQLTVRSDGRITLQLVNDVVAAGLTPAELTSVLTRAYSGELANPKIAVILRSSTDKIYVDGEVNRAGVFSINGPTTVLQSIAQAGGVKDSAKTDEVLVLRKAENNRLTAIKVNVRDALRGEGATGDMLVRPNDIVYVPRSAIGDVNAWIDKYIRKNIPLPLGLGYSL